MSTEAPFLAACRSQPTAYTPVWFMRQAGRSLPEYRAMRGEEDILRVLETPELAAEITLQPVRRLGVDAAILFSDILAPVASVGFDVRIEKGVGPVTDRPIRSRSDLERLRPLEPEIDCPWVAETVAGLVADCPVPVIGFAGGPFTIASYLVEGRPTRDFVRVKTLMYSEPALWHDLMDRVAQIAVASLRDQISAGAAAVQLFDSWAGALSPRDYRQHVLPWSKRIFEGISDLGVPRIHFGVGTGSLLGAMAEAGPEVVGVDWRVPLSDAALRVGPGRALQGNLDPVVCLGPWDAVADAARAVLEERPAGTGHIFNLGHGVLPATDPDVLERLVDFVHEETRVP
jgi:uroporphyrinogen decarboxylase